jgi:class 3 adenylate cyclase/tetratricopeptide (TPR) repeat protein
MRDVAQNVARFDKWIGPPGWTSTGSAFGVAGGIASHVLNCSNCGHENPDGAKFCMECAAPLGTASVRPIAEERKVVTCLFCDLVGFTATSESADPEDVDKMLAAYFAMARTAIETFGGTVEKFIGDAVVGVFGVPAVHEDDPERAVRAGLRIAEDAEELEAVGGNQLKLRVGINTGGALVRLGVSAASGEGFLTGDSINTASRIQSVAPQMGVAVGLGTYEATAAVFEYEELESATLKGKSEPVRIFHAKSPRARFGTDLTRTHDTPFIGREIDLALLKAIFDKTVAADAPQLVTVVGEPGLGKSRIVAELFGYIDTKPELITWRQGRCLPYGEGITFWALGEILKAHAGILESDTPQVAQTKLEAVLPEGDERPWFRQRLLPLLGIEATSTAAREELFTAWRRFLEHIAEQDPTVLVFEDLHWADDAMLAFLEHLADRAEGVPLLVVGSARPELFERHPDYGKLRNATPINLAPLTEEETARLVSALLETTVIPAELQQPILDRAGGNPLYAEEFVRLLKDKDLLIRKGASWELREGAEVPFSDSVQALIAARLDTLSSDTKSMLANAAVIGKVFWAGAIAQMGERDLTAVTDMLRELSRKELVRPARRSSIEGEAEYSFWHILARDVAYSQLPRASRASRHIAAARWIESKAPQRVEDLADVLAYHYATALELAKAAGQTGQASELEAPALKFLSLAGERALGLDTAAALAHLERALALAPEGHPERAEALARFGKAAQQAGRFIEAADALEEAIAIFRAHGDIRAAARAMGALFGVLSALGDPRCWTLPAEALELLEPLGPSPALVGALTEVAANDALQRRSEDAVRVADRALGLASELGLPRPARALDYRGVARADLGDPGGIEDFREAIELATEAGQGREVALLHNNLGIALSSFEGPVASLEVAREGIAYAEARGLTEALDLLNADACLIALIDSGEHEQVLALAAEMAPRLEASGDVFDLIGIRAAQVRVLAMRGLGSQVAEVLDWLEPAARGTEDPQLVVDGLGSAALMRGGLGQGEAAAALLSELRTYPGVPDTAFYPWLLAAMVRTALGIGELSLAERLVGGLEPRYPYAEHSLVAANAALTEARGNLQAAADAYADAVDRWARFGVVPEQAFALLGQGRCLLGLARPTEAAPVLQHAREIFERLGATPALAETDALLAAAA